MMKHYFDENFYGDLLFFFENYPNSVQCEGQSIAMSDKKEIFEQAVYCFLTPATKSDSADYTYKALFKDDFFYNADLDGLAACLREKPYIRFHNQKAARLLLWRDEGMKHVENMLALGTPAEMRDYIVKNVKGMNFKEATHFLRNVGLSGDLVILDRHIINFMHKTGILDENLGMDKLSKNYLGWEKSFAEFIKSSEWLDVFGDSNVPRADFAIWAAHVKAADPSITRERVLLLR